MNEKITFPRLASLLADKSGRSKRFSEDFLREFFSLISETLEAGDSVKIKGLGSFRLSRVEPRRSVDVTTGEPMEISGHSKIVFVPSKEIAAAVDAPFEAFTAQEIPDGIDLSILSSGDEIELQTPANDDSLCTDSDLDIAPLIPADIIPVVGVEDNGPEVNHTDLNEESESSEDEPAEVVEPHTQVAQPKEDENMSETETSDVEDAMAEDGDEDEATEEEWVEEERPRKAWFKILLISFGAAMIALLAILCVWYFFAFDNFNKTFTRFASVAGLTLPAPAAGTQKATAEIKPVDAAQMDSAIADVTDSIGMAEEEVPTAPSDPIVYDTISTTRFLTTMARIHYGNFNLWPYIYEENKSILGHPDRIRPGTPVVIPKLSKYGIDPSSKDDIEKAKKMGIEIYARYGKKI